MLARFVSPLLLVALVPAGARAGAPPESAVPWIVHPDDGLRRSTSERVLGVNLKAEDWPEGFWQDDMYFGPDSYAQQHLDALGLPLPAVNYEATPGVLYLAMEGVTLRNYCGTGDSANAAANCSPLVDSDTSFPSYGNQSQRDALEQTLKGYLSAFDLVVTQTRPPSYLGYTMAVIGGSSSNAGQPGGVCGVANVACDGLKRNHVSLTFPSSCPGPAAVAGQETAHNWGLEHTDNNSDLLYPYATGGSKSYVNNCMDINHATGNGITACGYIHEAYCPAGAGEQQNSYTELMGVFGPRTPDTVAPEIVNMQPADGSEFTPEDNILVTAMVSENSNFAGVKWTWLEGVPPAAQNDDGTLTRCTNNTCDDEINLGLDIQFDNLPLDFINLNGPPPGTYRFQMEVMDSYGNSDLETISFTVVGEGTGGPASTGPTTTGGSTSTSSSGSGSGSGSGTDSGPGPGSGSSGTAGMPGGSTGGPVDTTGPGPTGGGTPGENGDPEGCVCHASSGIPPLWIGLSLLPLFRRRRRG